MRHLHFTQSLEPLQGGGLGSSAVALHRQFIASGVDSVLCSTYGKSPQRPAEATVEFPRLGPEPFYFAPGMNRDARRLVRESDVIHGHGLYAGPNFVLGREARRQKKPLVYHAHGFFEPWILTRSRWKKRLVHWLFEDANFAHARLWRALTSKEAEQIRAQGILAPVVIAPNGLNLEDYPRPADVLAPIETPLIAWLKKAGPRLLFLGRIHPKKGLDLLLPAWAGLAAERKQWELVIAGPDEQGYLAEIRRLAQVAGIGRQVCFTGAVTGRAKNALLHSADLFVLPSYSEGFSMSLLEALACEVPVVATRACNFPDVSAAAAGWECESTAESLTTTLREAIREGDSARRQRGQNGKRLVREHYSWPAILSQLLAACAAHCAP
jgi:glycosyltransferase involved in cell wall biosynthesis